MVILACPKGCLGLLKAAWGKQESPFETVIFQFIGVHDPPRREQEQEEAMPLAKLKRRRTAAGGHAAEEGAQGSGSAAGPSGTAAAEEERAAAAPEKQVALVWEHSMRLLLPVTIHLGRDRVLVPLLLRRWVRRLEGSTALKLDLLSPDTVFKVGAAVQGCHLQGWRVGRPGATP